MCIKPEDLYGRKAGVSNSGCPGAEHFSIQVGFLASLTPLMYLKLAIQAIDDFYQRIEAHTVFTMLQVMDNVLQVPSVSRLRQLPQGLAFELDAGCQLLAGVDVEFGVDVLGVGADGVDRDYQALGDVLASVSGGEQLQYLAFT